MLEEMEHVPRITMNCGIFERRWKGVGHKGPRSDLSVGTFYSITFLNSRRLTTCGSSLMAIMQLFLLEVIGVRSQRKPRWSTTVLSQTGEAVM